MSIALPAKKSAWSPEKTLFYEFLGATKNPGGQLRLRSKEVDGLELKCKPNLPRDSRWKGGQEPSQALGVALPFNGCYIHGQVTVFLWVSVSKPIK